MFENERSTVVAELPPLSETNARVTNYFLPTAGPLLVEVHIGAISADGSVRVLRGSDSSGTGSENASATVAIVGTGDNKLYRLTLNPDTYMTSAKPYLAIQVNPGGTYLSSVTVKAVDQRFTPGTNDTDVTALTAPAAA